MGTALRVLSYSGGGFGVALGRSPNWGGGGRDGDERVSPVTSPGPVGGGGRVTKCCSDPSLAVPNTGDNTLAPRWGLSWVVVAARDPPHPSPFQEGETPHIRN